MSKIASKKRAPSTVVVCPIVYGSVAMHLGKKSEEYSTHRWKLYIRGPNNEDLSCFVQKVAFTLHPSFAEPIREVKKAPFEVSETGWGEFEASIRIFFKDPEERPLDLFHLIKLYPPGPPQLSGSLKKPAPVVAEQYDEIVFSEPAESFLEQLMAYTSRESKQLTPLQIEGLPVAGTLFDDSLDLERLQWIQDHVLREIDVAKERLMSLQAQVVAATQQRRAEQRVLKAQQQQQQQSGEAATQQQGDGQDENGAEPGSGAAGAAKSAGRSGGGAGATKAAGSKAAGAGAGAKRARPSTSGSSGQAQGAAGGAGAPTNAAKKPAASGATTAPASVPPLPFGQPVQLAAMHSVNAQVQQPLSSSYSLSGNTSSGNTWPQQSADH